MQQKKIALVTGGSRGLGKDMALNLARQGRDVVLTYLSRKEEAQAVADEIRAMGQIAAILQLDTSNIASFPAFSADLREILATVFHSEKISFLVNNAGVGIHASFAETTEQQFDTLLNIHFKSVFFLTQQLLPVISDGGGIVNISTGLARFSQPGYAAYAAMKGAVETLSRYQAKELGARGIRVNVVAPGAIATDFGGGVVRDNGDVNAYLAAQTALGRVGRATDIGPVVAFLCSDEAAWITAQRIEASGGMFL